MTTLNNHKSAGELIKRDQFETILRTALILDEIRFARQAALAWLARFPGDLSINLLYAQALIRAGLPDQAIPVLERVCERDPEYREAVEALVQADAMYQFQHKPTGGKGQAAARQDRVGWLLSLGGSPDALRDAGLGHAALRDKNTTDWSRALSKARLALGKGQLENAEREIHTGLVTDSNCPLMYVSHLEIMRARMSANKTGYQMLRSLASFYRERWPDCLVCILLLAEALMDSGEPDQAVALLHEAAAKDVTGQVAVRLWGDNHPYRSLWPSEMGLELDLPIPASISSALGWNRLPELTSAPQVAENTSLEQDLEEVVEIPIEQPEFTGQSDEPSPAKAAEIPETVRIVQAELERLSSQLNQPGLANTDGRYPIYVIMTTRQGMRKRFGDQTADTIESEMLRLANAVQQRQEWGALLFYADEGSYLRREKSKPVKLDRTPARASDPWGLKLALLDLDTALKRHGERIGAVLIVGGPEIVPFHQLPNPVDDADSDVASDNPYSTSDENYFIPEWPIGRLPEGASSEAKNPQILLYTLSGLRARHLTLARTADATSWYRRWFERLLNWVKRQTHLPNYIRPSYGYTAAVWRQASMSVFRPIGEPRSLFISPPDSGQSGTSSGSSNSQMGSPLPVARLGYFNLHGLEDASEWYGQCETGSDGLPGLIGDGEDYPIAVRPSDILNSGRAPQVVFSEACYGAHILNKAVDDALSLKFLQVGTQAVVGSTCISYGSISPPLIAADFLAYAFWSYIRDGLPAGEALRRAKISLAREMHNRQGYLDGEDQKTLISFVLYGDPLAVPVGLEIASKSILRPVRPPANIKTVCDLAHEDEVNQPVPPEILEFVKSVVEQYLPGMEDAQLTLSHEHVDCEAVHPKHPLGSPEPAPAQQVDHLTAHQPFQLARQVITLSKQVPNSTHLHRHYARLTLDAQGKLVKLVVSH